MSLRDKTLWLGFRQGLLMIVDAIERFLGIRPTTADLRKEAKRE